MHHYIYGQHREGLPVMDLRISVICHGVEHHETADQETDNYGQLGIDQFGIIVGSGNLDEHQQNSKNGRPHSYDQLYGCINIYIYRDH